MKSLLLLLVCTVALTWWPTEQHPAIPENGTVLSMDARAAQAVLDEVNALRAKGCNCPGKKYFPPAPALNWDKQLARIAQAHADDMYKREYFSHSSKNGIRFSERIRRGGYDWSYVGENIAMGYPTAAQVVEAWRTSKDHCPNLMSANFKDMGVGKSGAYWVQDFGARKE